MRKQTVRRLDAAKQNPGCGSESIVVLPFILSNSSIYYKKLILLDLLRKSDIAFLVNIAIICALN